MAWFRIRNDIHTNTIFCESHEIDLIHRKSVAYNFVYLSQVVLEFDKLIHTVDWENDGNYLVVVNPSIPLLCSLSRVCRHMTYMKETFDHISAFCKTLQHSPCSTKKSKYG